MQIVGEWGACIGTPYRWGGKTRGVGLDCSGLIEAGWHEAGVWPFDGDASADMIWKRCPKVEWFARQPGDAILYGEKGIAHHIVGVFSIPSKAFVGQIIGANHGGPMRDGEKAADYVRRMEIAGAKVVVTSDDYWESRRLGVVRAPRLEVS